MTESIASRCCEWHDALPEMWSDNVGPDDCWGECGLAGMGRPSVCCAQCPEVEWFINGRGMKPADIDFAKDIMALPLRDRP